MKSARGSGAKAKTFRPLTAEDMGQFEAALSETAQTFKAVRQRYREVRQAQQQHQQLSQADLPRQELARLQAELEQLELTLESRLVTWRNFQEPFWQAVRFGGLGLLLGWLLRGCAG
ncbi:DUF2203 domain-containing protein [Sphaerothrix gracilis]|uniref:DUF2203 domain-containing protein n=1 Tax=Sphaerothrix gracilis TaxID=3151835 RepID=UPI0031FC36A8